MSLLTTLAVILSAVALPIILKVEFNFEVILYITISIFLSPGSCFKSAFRYQNSISKHTDRHVIQGCWRKEKFFTRKVWEPEDSAPSNIPFWGHFKLTEFGIAGFNCNSNHNNYYIQSLHNQSIILYHCLNRSKI